MLPSTLVGCSTKGYLGLAETRSWAERVASGLAARGGGDGVYACVPHPLVTVLSEGLAGTGADVGVQDVSPHPKGPYTGEVSAELLAELGVRYVMVGHPERVRHVGETPELFGRKVRAAVGHGLVPILVVGEPERSAEPEPVLRAQLDAAFGGLPDDAEVVVAYEPTWAIGAAEPAPADHVLRTVGVLRTLVDERVARSRVLYGGSAGPGTFAAIARAGAGGDLRDVPDGVFLGRGGLDPDAFLATVAEVRAAVGAVV
ncbi:triose-phosphate isomerase family protein [Cellulosimicrobium composti]|uniref:Triosephosphate isomerase n=1 Tax=Cellulosimicrobium composti TaxID=2672572 RepID=A0ABX0BFN8_9MICO|nr:triose-phosphate isomerase family protein [Cellulosimicrobium composti]NDO91298.1 triosephosphate isomerase [Cellulosimicrobium composti]